MFRMIQDFHDIHGFLPPVLFLNVDNCGRENKVSNDEGKFQFLSYQQVISKFVSKGAGIGRIITERE